MCVCVCVCVCLCVFVYVYVCVCAYRCMCVCDIAPHGSRVCVFSRIFFLYVMLHSMDLAMQLYSITRV